METKEKANGHHAGYKILESCRGIDMVLKSKEERLVGERNFDSIFSYDAGTIRSKFLTEIRDNKKIVGTRCTKCKLVYVPARSICLKCFSNLTDFVEVGKSASKVEREGSL